MAHDQTPFEPGATLARVKAIPEGWIIDCRGPKAAAAYKFHHASNAAELAFDLRDSGWSLRFHPSAWIIERLVEEITHDFLS